MMQDEAVEIIARALAQDEGQNPDQMVYHEHDAPFRRDPIPAHLIGTRRADGSIVRQYPAVPLWRWRYAATARTAIAALERSGMTVSKAKSVRRKVAP